MHALLPRRRRRAALHGTAGGEGGEKVTHVEPLEQLIRVVAEGGKMGEREEEG